MADWESLCEANEKWGAESEEHISLVLEPDFSSKIRLFEGATSRCQSCFKNKRANFVSKQQALIEPSLITDISEYFLLVLFILIKIYSSNFESWIN